jgi:glyoxylase-like metal-dependent hydrolase (beta-lactamase superfamily II)
MQVHHLNCGAMQPLGGSLFDGVTPGLGPATLACHCLLLEGPDGLVLVDTGVVGQDERQSRAAHSPAFLAVDNLRLDPRESAAARIRALGHRVEDVCHVVMTHLDFDHAAGLVDFPGAAVHLSEVEAAAACRPEGAKAAARYRPGQWGGVGRWQTYQLGRSWFGLPAAEVLGEDVLLVGLPGHTRGHCGVAVRQGAGWLLHAGDAMFFRSELEDRPSMPTAARGYQWFMETSQAQRRRSLKALRAVVRDAVGDVQVVCTHDPRGVDASPVAGLMKAARRVAEEAGA